LGGTENGGISICRDLRSDGFAMRMPDGVGRLAHVEDQLSLSRNSGVLPGRHLVTASLSCLSSQLLRPPSPAASADRSQIEDSDEVRETERSGKQVTPRSKDFPALNVTRQNYVDVVVLTRRIGSSSFPRTRLRFSKFNSTYF